MMHNRQVLHTIDMESDHPMPDMLCWRVVGEKFWVEVQLNPVNCPQLAHFAGFVCSKVQTETTPIIHNAKDMTYYFGRVGLNQEALRRAVCTSIEAIWQELERLLKLAESRKDANI